MEKIKESHKTNKIR